MIFVWDPTILSDQSVLLVIWGIKSDLSDPSNLSDQSDLTDPSNLSDQKWFEWSRVILVIWVIKVI